MTLEITATTPLPDLRQCEAEPIQIPGSIQPHGVLLALHRPTLRITQATTTCQTLSTLNDTLAQARRSFSTVRAEMALLNKAQTAADIAVLNGRGVIILVNTA